MKRKRSLNLISLQGTPSRIGGVNFEVLAEEAFERHHLSYSERGTDMLVLRNPGYYHWRNGGEKHINDPLSIANLQVSYAIKEFQRLFSILKKCLSWVYFFRDR